MYKAWGLIPISDESAQTSFRDQSGWLPIVPGLLMFNTVVLGKEIAGPSTALISCEPATLPPAPAHWHASDSLRICIRGEQLQGRQSYGPGEFRFQEGWVPYADEGFGTDGMWGVIVLADRRGARARLVDTELDTSPGERQFRLAQKERSRSLDIEVDDMLSDDPADTAGPSATITSLGSPQGKLDGTFADRSSWLRIGPDTQIVVGLMGEPTVGPVSVLSATAPGAVAAPRCRFETELMRIVVAGSCTVGDATYEAGDVQIIDGGAWCDDVVAGPEGLHELVVLANRRFPVPSMETAPGTTSWLSAIGSIVKDLAEELAARPRSKRSETRRLATFQSS